MPSRQSGSHSGGGGGLVGPIFVLAGILCLFFSDREVARARVMVQGGSRAVISVDPEKPLSEHQDRLVHFSGLVVADEVLVDPLFEISARGLVLRRDVEMYQWQEEEHRETRRDTRGRQRTTVTYTYDRGWVAYAVQSAAFAEPEGHENPGSMPFESATFVADEARLGRVAVPEALLEQILYREPVSPATAKVPELVELVAEPGEAYLRYWRDPPANSVGDVRVGFSIVPETYVSVIAQLKGDTVEPYHVTDGIDIFMIVDDLVPAEDMLERAQQTATEQKWTYRIVGFLLMVFGSVFIRGWIESIAHRVPVIAALKRSGVFFSVLLSLMLTGLVLSLAWLTYDVAIGLGILLPTVALVAGCHFLGRRKTA